MAEIVGLVASGISIGTLTVQIASSIIRLKEYWSQIKEAPEDIRLLVEEIEDLQLLLYKVENDRARNPLSSALLDETSASTCIEHCKRGADRLKELVDELDDEIRRRRGLKRKWASIKVVLEKSKIDKYKARLESAVRLLSLAYQCYTRALIQQQPDIIITRMTEILNVAQTQVQKPLEVEAAPPIQSSHSDTESYVWRSRKRKQAVARYRFQGRLLHKAWAIQYLNDVSGWTFQFRTYTFRSDSSPIFNYIFKGDLKGIQEYFSMGLASPNDMNERDSWSLIELAAFLGKLEICKFLLEQGADLNLTHQSPYMALNYFGESGLTYNQSKGAAVHGIMMLRHDKEVTASMLRCFRGTIEEFELLRREMELPYYSLPLAERVEVAIGLTRHALQNGPDLVRSAISPGPIPAEAFTYKTWTGETLLHGVAGALGQNMCPGSCDMGTFTKWRDLAVELIQGGADFNAVWEGCKELLFYMVEKETIGLEENMKTRKARCTCEGEERDGYHMTPFLCLFHGLSACRFYWPLEPPPQDPQALLEIWLEVLQVCDVDLSKYGRKEAKLHKTGSMQTKFRLFLAPGVQNIITREEEELEVRGFLYGKSVTDWQIPKHDLVAGWHQDFWGMVEDSVEVLHELTPELAMPGAWVF